MQLPPWLRSRQAIGVAAVALFLVPAIYATATHEMWRDEMQAWLIARDSHSLSALIHNLMHDGHPPLWHLLLYPIAHVTHDPNAMRPLHLAIAAGAVWIFATRAPFSRAARLLFGIGYFPVYEYAAICRNYGLGLLFAFALCAVWPARRSRPVTTGVVVALLALSNTVTWVIACVAIVPIAWDLLRSATRARGAWKAFAIAAAGILLSLAIICPKPGAGFAPRAAKAAFTASDALGFFIEAMIAIPRVGFYWWNENLLDKLELLAPLGMIAGVLVAVWVVGASIRGRTALYLYGVGSIALILFFGFVYRGDVRHHGFLFVLFLMGAWLARTMQRHAPRRSSAPITCVLALHVVGAVLAIAQERMYVFSSGERTAAWIRSHGLADAPMVGEPDWAVSTVIGYLQSTEGAWSPRTGRRSTYVWWDADRLREPSDAEVMAFTHDVCAREGRDTLLVLNHPLQPDRAQAAGLDLRAEMYDSVNPTENFAVYVMPARACAGGQQATR